MSHKQTGSKSSLLTITQLKRRLKELTKEEIIELFIEAVRSNKHTQSFVSVKIQGENAVIQLLENCKQSIYKQFYPTRGLPKLRVTAVEQAISNMRSVGEGTIWHFELLVYFCEVAVQHIHENWDIFEDMGDFFTDTYEAVIQTLNKEKTPDLYEKYQDRLKAIVDTKGCECWGIHDSLEGSYSVLKWVDHDEEEEEEEDGDEDVSGVISYAAMSKWLKIPEDTRQKYIHNVWCGSCSGMTIIEDFSVQLDTYGIILQGSCSNCGHQVARVIEK
jgi:hypothetical protein